MFAFDPADGTPVTADAANITAIIVKDDGTPAATNDANPTEINATTAPGYYRFDLTQAETDAQYFDVFAVSANAQLVTVGGRQFTVPAGYSTAALANLSNLDASVAAVEADTQDIQSTLATNLDAAVSTRSTFDASTDTVTVDPAQTPAVGPTPGTFDDLLLKGTTALPNAAPGAAGGLATFYNVSLFTTFTVTGTPTAGAFDTDLTDPDNRWNGYRAFFPYASSITVPGEDRKITSYANTNGRLTFSGSTGAEDASFSAAPTVGDIGIILAYQGT